MQNTEHLLNALTGKMKVLPNENVLLPLSPPPSVAKTQYFVEQFCNITQATQRSINWGADRCEVALELNGLEIEIHIDWLCDAVWLTCGLSQRGCARDIINTLKNAVAGKHDKSTNG